MIRRSDRKSSSRSEGVARHAGAALVLGLALTAGLGVVREASASPWALPRDRLALTASVDYSFGTEEFLDARRAQPFSLDGFFQSTTFVPSLRYGLGKGWDVEASVPIKVVSYESEPVILIGPTSGTPQEVFDGFQENVLDFSRTEAGFADIELGLRKQWIRGVGAFATQVVVKIPAGYAGPEGTFGRFPETEEEFLENPGEFVRPENIRDDVTLGDGQVDVTAWLHGGTATRGGLFVRAGLGYRLRLDGAADQIVSEARLGQAVFGRIVLYGGYRWGYSIMEGRPIGVSIAATDPELPPTEYGGLTNLFVRELRLENDELVVGGGVIFKVFPRVEINFGYDRTVWGRNVAATNALRMSIGYLANLRKE